MSAVSMLSFVEAAQFDRVFGSHMVLPQGKSLPVWGTGVVGEKVNVRLRGQEQSGVVDKDGKWELTFEPLKVSVEGEDIVLTSDSEDVILRDTLVGEVWLASGQSNMEWLMKMLPDTKEDIQGVNAPKVRIMQLRTNLHADGGKAYSEEEHDRITKDNAFRGTWRVSTPESIAETSAVSYFFATALSEILDMPVGIVCNAVGGSPIEAWLPKSTFSKRPEYADLTEEKWLDGEGAFGNTWSRQRSKQNLAELIKAGKTHLKHPFKPGYLYEYATEGLTRFPFTGVVWYQGESNAELKDIELNKNYITDWIESWREAFHQPTMPFVMIQLPRINSQEPLRQYWPEFRQAQKEAALAVNGAYLVCALDLGGTNSNVHPPRKKPVAERAASVAARNVYGKKDQYESSEITGADMQESAIIVHTSADALKTNDGQSPRCFEIRGEKGEYVPAVVEILNTKPASLKLSSPGVKSPVKFRYADHVYVEPNVVDEHDLPLFPYRGE